MRRGVKGLEDSHSKDQLTWLVLRVVAELAPCTKTSLIAYVSGGDSTSELRRELILNALLRLQTLAFIQFVREQIAITDKGRRFLEELPVVALRPRKPYVARLRALVSTLLAESLIQYCQDCLAGARAIAQRSFQINGRARDIVLQKWKRKVAPMIGSRATTLVHMLTRLGRLCRTRAEASAIVLGNRGRQTGALLWKAAKTRGMSPNTKLAGCSWLVIGAGAFVVVALSTAGGVAFLSGKRVEPDVSATPLIPRTGAIRTTAPSDVEQKPAETAATEPSNVVQDYADTANAPPIVAEQPPADPVVATIRSKLTDPALHKGASSEDLAALQSFYAERDGPPLWMTGTGFTARAQAVVSEIQDADEWGLSADAFDLPPAGDLPATPEAQATDEIKLDVAILKYARFARGGRLTPSRISDLLDQRPDLPDPKTVLSEISAAAAPDAYLRSLHPKHEQFERLRQALQKARAKSEERGKRPGSDPNIQRLVTNMERWRWMPADLGSYYVWDNIPEFVARVVKNGKTIYLEKIIVGKFKYPTSIFSAQMLSIVFHPEWTVPETIIKDDLQPALQQGGFFGGPSTAILEQHNLKVSYEGRPVDAETIDWGNANIRQYTFTQPPGPDNVLGTLKFNFPNKHAIYMHDTIQPELFAETVRTLSHGCIRLHDPDRLAALLLAEDRGWSAQQVKSLLAEDDSSAVTLYRPLPVHLTYFTAMVDEEGEVQTFADVYGIDSKMGAALFGKRAKLQAPTVEADAQDGQPRSNWRATERTGGLIDSISELFGN
jgi:murein L,D-transpeptidase YcbB/YkuD